MKYVEGQFMQMFAYLLLDHAEITSGAYKMCKTQQGVESGGWRDLTDEEKLKNCMNRMLHRIHMMDELMSYFEGGSNWYKVKGE